MGKDVAKTSDFNALLLSLEKETAASRDLAVQIGASVNNLKPIGDNSKVSKENIPEHGGLLANLSLLISHQRQTNEMLGIIDAHLRSIVG